MTNLINYYYKQTKQKQKEIAKTYHNWITLQDCCITGDSNVGRPHHVRFNQFCGIGIKPPDIFEIPITNELHVEGHTKGFKTFQKKYKIDLIDILTGIHDQFIEENNYVL